MKIEKKLHKDNFFHKMFRVCMSIISISKEISLGNTWPKEKQFDTQFTEVRLVGRSAMVWKGEVLRHW